MTYDLRAEAAHHVANSPACDPFTLAEQFHPLIPREQWGNALRQLLPDMMREILRGQRHKSAPVLAEHAASVGRSRRQRAAVAWWRAKLDASYEVGLAAGGKREWKRLRDCTRDDLLALASHRRGVAEANLAEAVRWEELAALLTSTGAATVGDLAAGGEATAA